jgi:hypothetical protein
MYNTSTALPPKDNIRVCMTNFRMWAFNIVSTHGPCGKRKHPYIYTKQFRRRFDFLSDDFKVSIWEFRVFHERKISRKKYFALRLLENRVTRLGKFSPIGWLLTLGSFWKLQQQRKNFLTTFSQQTSHVFILTKNGFCFNCGDFFTNLVIWSPYRRTNLISDLSSKA